MKTRNRLGRPVFLLFSLLLVLAAGRLDANSFWTGAGGDDNWSTPGNWLGGSKPPNPETTTMFFTQTDAGNTNIVDQNWTVRYLTFSNQNARHTVDLGGNRLVVQNTLTAGKDSTNNWVTIRNGTLQLGSATLSCSLYSGHKTLTGQQFTNANLTITSDLVVSNGATIYVGYSGDAIGTVGAVMDLSGASISTKNVQNVLIMTNAWISYRATNSSTLKLPASLNVFELNGALYLGNYGLAPAGIGIIDFGDNSSLTNFRVRGDCLLGDYSGTAIITNLPPGVHLEVGQPGAPKKFYVSNHTGRQPTGTEAKLKLDGGRFTGYLSELLVGTAHTEAEGTGTGDLDIASAEVQIGPEPNKITNLGLFKICSGRFAYGRLRIPSAITEISVGTFSLGRGVVSGTTGKEPQGILDIGSNSQLRIITATNGFYWATENGKAFMGYTNETGQFVEYFPTGLTLTVGSTNAPAPFHLAGANVPNNYTWYPYNTGSLVLAHCTLRAYLTDFCVGFISDTTAGHPHYGFPRGLLDLTDATVVFNGVTNSVTCNRMIVGGTMRPAQSGPQGKLILPASVTNFNVGSLSIGCGGSYRPITGEGILDFGSGSQLRTFTVAQDFWMGAQNGDTGRIVNLPAQDLDFTVGSPASRGSIWLGMHDTYGTIGHLGIANLSLTGATFRAWLTNLYVGVSYSAGVYGGVLGKLDLSQSSLATLDVDGPVIVGMGSNTYATSKNNGTLILPEGSARFGSLAIGNLNTTNTYGLVELKGTRLTVSNQFILYPSGAMTNHLVGVSAGLDLLSDDPARLVISNTARLHLTFDADPLQVSAAYWGLRMAGDQRVYLQSLRDSGKITWTTNALSPAYIERFGIHYEPLDDTTYVGVGRPLKSAVLIWIQ